MKDRDTKRYAQKETVTATGTEGNAQRNNISRNSLSLLNIALILGLLMQDYNINSPNINGRAIAFFAVELSRNKTTIMYFLDNENTL